MVDQRCRESERKVKIEGYMSVSDEEAHHRSHLFDGHMTYDSHIFTSIFSVSNVPPPAVQPITSSHTVWSGTFYNFTLCSHSCLSFVFNLPVFTFR